LDLGRHLEGPILRVKVMLGLEHGLRGETTSIDVAAVAKVQVGLVDYGVLVLDAVEAWDLQVFFRNLVDLLGGFLLALV
jgi:hypothetical protein